MDQLICASLSPTHYWYNLCTVGTTSGLVYLNGVMYCIVLYGHTYSKSMDQLGKVANPARGQLNRENEYFPVPVRV